jgi:hypothetical protein
MGSTKDLTVYFIESIKNLFWDVGEGAYLTFFIHELESYAPRFFLCK